MRLSCSIYGCSLYLGSLNSSVIRADNEETSVVFELLVLLLTSTLWPRVCCMGLNRLQY
jgi:hypothetical protein